MNKKKTDTSLFRGIILFLCAGIIPFIVKMETVAVRAGEYGVVRGAKAMDDYFSYDKMTILIILGVVLLIYSVMDADLADLKEKIKKPVFLLPAVFLGLSFLSAVLSHTKDVAFFGATERYEGFFVWAVYMFMFASTLVYVKDRRSLYIVMGGLACGALLTGTVGVLQFFGHDPYKSDLFASVIVGSEKYAQWKQEGKRLVLNFSSVFSTLYNPNCVGIYTGMLCPFFLFSGIFAPIKKWYKYALLAVSVILLINLFGCESLGGFMGLAAGLGFSGLVCIFYFAKSSGKARVIVPAAVIVSAVAVIAVVFSGGSKIVQKINVIKEAMNDSAAIENPYFFEDLKIEDNSAKIVTKTGTIVIPAENGDWSVKFIPAGANEAYDVETVPVVMSDDEKNVYTAKYSCTLPGLVESGVNVLDKGLIIFSGGDAQRSTTTFYFKIEGNNISVLDMFGNDIDLNKQYKSIGFKGMERLGSNRGYIWSRSIPLIAKNLIIGAGPDCFVFEFPQQDILSKLNFLGNPNIIIDKPHNFYLQVAINTGLVSLVVLLVLFVMYIADTVKAIFKTDGGFFMTGLRLGAMAGVIGYLTAVVTTDSVVSVSPVFWILLGFGFAVNKVIAED